MKSLEEFKVISQIGTGTFGKVYKVEHRNSLYALKQINISSSKKQYHAMKEVSILKDLNHPNIIKYFASFVQKQSLFIVMEYAEGGNLQSLIDSYKKANKSFEEKTIWNYFRQLVSGLDYLHNKGIIHRDLKALNVLLKENGTIKLGDLGSSKLIKNNLQQSNIGTPLYFAPEQVKNQPYDYKVDIWALGCIIYSLCSLTHPFKGNNMSILGKNILSIQPQPIPSIYQKTLADLVYKCLEKRANARLSLKEIKELLFVSDSKQSEESKENIRRASTYSKSKQVIKKDEQSCHSINEQDLALRNEQSLYLKKEKDSFSKKEHEITTKDIPIKTECSKKDRDVYFRKERKIYNKKDKDTELSNHKDILQKKDEDFYRIEEELYKFPVININWKELPCFMGGKNKIILKAKARNNNKNDLETELSSIVEQARPVRSQSTHKKQSYTPIQTNSSSVFTNPLYKARDVESVKKAYYNEAASMIKQSNRLVTRRISVTDIRAS